MNHILYWLFWNKFAVFHNAIRNIKKKNSDSDEIAVISRNETIKCYEWKYLYKLKRWYMLRQTGLKMGNLKIEFLRMRQVRFGCTVKITTFTRLIYGWQKALERFCLAKFTIQRNPHFDYCFLCHGMKHLWNYDPQKKYIIL